MTEQKKYVIAFDAKRLFTNFTGLGNYSRTLVRNLATYFPQHTYHLFTPRIIKNADTAWFIDSGLFTIHTPKNGSALWRPVFMAREVNALKPDIFHGLSHEIPFGLDPEISTFVTFHDIIYLLYPEQFGLWDRWMYRIKYRSAARRAGTVIAISQSTAKDVRTHYNLPYEKVQVIYQSCQAVFQAPVEAEAAIIPPGLPTKPYFLYVGSLIPRKGLDRILQALSAMSPELRKPVVVVGSGKGEFVRQIQACVARCNLREYVYFVPHVTNTALVQIYDRSYALLYPSLYEGFGIPVIESLFRSKPVITSTVSSMPEAAGPGAILVPPDSVSALRDAMVHIQQPRVAEQLGILGRTYVSEKFGSRETAEKLMSLYLNNAVQTRP